jgi:hypothetical protein
VTLRGQAAVVLTVYVDATALSRSCVRKQYATVRFISRGVPVSWARITKTTSGLQRALTGY